MAFNADQVLDCSGMACPRPIIKNKKAVNGLQVGQVLQMIAADPGSVSDAEAWTKKNGHELLGHQKDGDKFIFLIKRTK